MAISASSYAVGNRLYKGATSAPTRGRVDPTGYIDRELNNVASRSGIAASALRRMGSPAQTQQAQPSSGPTQAAPSSMTGQSGQIKSLGGGLGGNQGFGASQSGLGGSLRVSPVGKLTPPKLKSTTDLPFDPEKADAENELRGQKDQFAYQANQARNNLERDYTTGKRQVSEEQPNNQRRLLENYAGRGMAYSSGYAYDQGELGRTYANQLGQLEEGRTGGLADLLQQEGLFNNQYGQRMSAIQQAAARRAAEQAAEIELENKAMQEQYERDQAAERARLFPPDAPLSPEQIATNSNYVPPAGEVPNFGPYDPNSTGTLMPGIAPGMRPRPGGGVTPSFTPSAPPPPPIATIEPAPYSPPPTAPTAPPPPPVQQQQPMDLASRPGGTRTMSSFDAKSRQVLSNGGTIVGGNGYTYKYDPNTGQTVRVK